MPATLLRDVQLAIQFKRRNAFLGVQDDENRDEPLFQADLRILEDRPSSRGESVAAVQARPLLASRDFGNLFAAATGTFHAFRPANFDKVLAAGFVIGKLFDQLNQIHGLSLFVGAEPVRIMLARAFGLTQPVCLSRQPLARLPGFLPTLLL